MCFWCWVLGCAFGVNSFKSPIESNFWGKHTITTRPNHTKLYTMAKTANKKDGTKPMKDGPLLPQRVRNKAIYLAAARAAARGAAKQLTGTKKVARNEHSLLDPAASPKENASSDLELALYPLYELLSKLPTLLSPAPLDLPRTSPSCADELVDNTIRELVTSWTSRDFTNCAVQQLSLAAHSFQRSRMEDDTIIELIRSSTPTPPSQHIMRAFNSRMDMQPPK